jgi:activator of HSP90 ATPase
VKSVDTVEGDVDVNVRKGKVIYIFDIKVELTFTSDGVDGTLTLPECSYDVSPKDYEYEIKCDDDLKAVVKNDLLPLIHAVFEKFPTDLLNENGPSLLVEQTRTEHKDVPSEPVAVVNGHEKQFDNDKPVAVTSISVQSEFKCSKQDLLDALFNPQRVQIWTGEPCKISLDQGSDFTLMGGHITGKLESVGDSVKLKWRLKSWPQGHFSDVTMSFKEGSDSTTLKLSQKGVPKTDELQIASNWEQIYFNRIKHIFGYVI